MGCHSDCPDRAPFTTDDLDKLARRSGETDAALIFWAKRRIEATKEGPCGHWWDREVWDGCPVCAMMSGMAVRIHDIEQDRDKLKVQLSNLENIRRRPAGR